MTFEKQIKIWVEKGKIKEEEPHQDQINVLLEKAQKDINVAKLNIEIDLETAFTISYNSMLKAGRALILSKGYRTTDGSQHKTTVDFCGYFIDKKLSSIIKTFDHMRRTRNTIAYDPWYYSSIEMDDVIHAIKTTEKFLEEIKNQIY